MKLFLRIPTEDKTDRELTRWYGWFARQQPDADIGITYTSCYGIAEGRNDIVREFLQTDCTHLWMIDSDTVPPYSLGILDLIEEHPVVCGPYRGFKQGHGVIWHVYKKLPVKKNGRDGYVSVARRGWPRHRAFKADAAGTGCMIIQRTLLESLPMPVFDYLRHDDGTRGTDDFFFCQTIGGVVMDGHYVCRHYKDIDLENVEQWQTELATRQQLKK